MRLLLDSHTLLWCLSEPERLPQTVLLKITDPDAMVYVSLATVWELRIKENLGKLSLPLQLLARIDRSGFRMLSIALEHIDVATSLPRHHRDPFDRMLIAQAQVEGMTLVSADRKAAAYDVPLLWS